MTSVPPAPAESRCARHPAVETVLRCGRCDTPICPRCLVQSPVGARCPTCASPTRLPTFQVTPGVFLRAAGAGVAAGAVLGAIWAVLPLGGFLVLLPAAGAGYALGEAVSLAANRKRAAPLQVLAAALSLATFFWAQMAGVLLAAGPASLPGPQILAPLVLAVLMQTLRNPFLWLVVAVSILVAVGRVR